MVEGKEFYSNFMKTRQRIELAKMKAMQHITLHSYKLTELLKRPKGFQGSQNMIAKSANPPSERADAPPCIGIPEALITADIQNWKRWNKAPVLNRLVERSDSENLEQSRKGRNHSQTKGEIIMALPH